MRKDRSEAGKDDEGGRKTVYDSVLGLMWSGEEIGGVEVKNLPG